MNLKKLINGVWFPWLIASLILVTFSITFFSLQYFSQLRHRNIEQDELSYLARLGESCYIQHVNGLEMESLLVAPMMGQQGRFAEFSEKTHSIFNSFLAINRINTQGEIVEVYPYEPNKNALGANVLKHKSLIVQDAARKALESKVTVNTSPVPLLQGGMGSVIYIPQIHDGKLTGLINGVFRYEDFLNSCLKNTPSFFQRMNLQFNGVDLLDHPKIEDSVVLEQTILFGDLELKLTLQNTPNNQSLSSTIAQFAILVLGFLVSILVAYLLRKSGMMQRRAEDNELTSQRLYNQIHVGIFILQDGHIIQPNQASSELTGRTTEELATVSFLEILHPDYRKQVTENHIRRLKGMSIPTSYELKLLKKSGEAIWVHLDTGIISWKGKPATLNVVKDISEVKMLQAQIAEAERMEVQGLMASGLAHDFNNILTSIGGYTEMLLMDLQSDGAGQLSIEMLEAVQQQVLSASQLTRQLLGLAKGSANKVEVFDLNEVIEDSVVLFQRTHKGIACQFDRDGDQMIVEADKGQVEQILLNLLVNSDNVLSGKGDILIMLACQELEEREAQLKGLSAGKYFCVTLEDSGPGVAEELRSKIFQPFFTQMSGVKKGTGLGLASALSIAKKHGGCLLAGEPKYLKGIHMELYIKASDKPQMHKKPVGEDTFLCSGLIAIVDDEDSVRKTISGLLTRHGCKIVDFDNGKSFLDWVDSTSVKPALLVLDMVMPEMDGYDVFSALRVNHPQIPVLIVTGYARDDLVKNILIEPATNLLKKPFVMTDLIAAINRLTEDKSR